jgi:UDP-3-O-[3-hydroxymyristoyl] glucosamine N-acyltransferase
VRERSKLGDRVILQNGARIGSDGFGQAPKGDGTFVKIPQVGRVVIEDDVEVGANTCIDRASFHETFVGQGTKFDNLVQVGHNVHIGKNCILVSQTGLSGSVELEDSVTLAGQVGVSGHLTIGEGATVGGKSGVTRDVPAGQLYTGYPSMPHARWKAIQAMLDMLLDSAEEEARLMMEAQQAVDGEPHTPDDEGPKGEA